MCTSRRYSPPRWSLLFFLVTTATCQKIESPPKIVKEPLVSLFSVTARHNVTNEPFVFDCEAEGEPAPEYHWTKNDKDFDWRAYGDRITQRPGHGTLNITKPRIEDVGKYQCVASNDWGSASSNPVTVVTEMEIDKIVREGDPFKLECEPPTSRPKSDILWMTQNLAGQLDTINNSRMTADPEGILWFSNVTLNDTSKSFTYACGFASKSQDRITDIILWSKINLTVTRDADTVVRNERAPVRQYVTGKNEAIMMHEKIEMFCIYGGTPLPETVWLKDGTVVRPTERVSPRNYGKSLLVQRAEPEDSGNYTCKVSNDVGPSQSYNIALDVNVVPYFNVTPEDVIAAVGETARIECLAIGRPVPAIQWTLDGRPLNETPPDPGRFTITSNSITIEPLIKTDTGTYGCNASNSVGYVYKDVYVNVLALPPKITEPPSDLETVDGRDVTVKCKHVGMPKPRIKWTRNDEEFAGERYTTQADGDLQISAVDLNDNGNYACIATNVYGTANASGQLTVRKHTVITDGPEDYVVVAGSTATFKCTANVDSSLSLDVQWLANDEPVRFDDQSRFVKANDFSMAIANTTESDSGTYTCMATTELDEATASAQLTVLDRPKPPELLGITCNQRDAAVKWQPKGDNLQPILHYIVEYNTSHDPDVWSVASDDLPASQRTHIVPMTPWTNYTFRVVATNDIGRSNPSPRSSVCTTLADVPYKNPDNVVAAGTEPSNLVISWTPISKTEYNAPDFRYRVYWKQDAPDQIWNSEEIVDPTQNELVVSDQPTYQRYGVKVIAVNEKGESNAHQNEVIGYSGEDVPTEAPQNITVLNITESRSAILSWEPVSTESIRGNFTGYKIQLWTEMDGENHTIEEQVDSNKTSVEITNLLHNAKYNARVVACNNRFDGPTSELIYFDTPEGVPGPVKGVSTKQWGSSAISLSWEKPEQANGVLTGYEISYEPSTTQNGVSENIRSLTVTDPNQTTIKLASLTPETSYRIYVKATTKVGAGEPISVEQQTKPPLPEGMLLDKPEFKYEHVVNNNIFDTVRISWTPKLDGNPGSHFFVKYKIKGEDAYRQTEPVLDTNVMDVNGLVPGEVYDFIVVAVDGDIKKESDAVQIEASSTADPRIRRSEYMATSGWFIAMLLALLFFIILLTIVCVVKNNKRGKYAVYESETARGRRDCQDDLDFPEYSQPLGAARRSDCDADSTPEYSEDEMGMTEDGSFIGLYCNSVLDETISTGQRISSK